MNDNTILTAPEVAKLFKVCPKTVYTWAHRADFPAVKIGNTIRIPYGLLMSWVEAQATNKEAVQ